MFRMVTKTLPPPMGGRGCRFGANNLSSNSWASSFPHTSTTSNIMNVQPHKVQVILDRNIYNPGDTVTGKIYFDLTKFLTCDYIEVQLFGQLRVYWTDEKVSSTALRKVEAFEKKRVLIEKTECVWKKDPKMRKQKPSLDEIVRYSSGTTIRSALPRDETVPGFDKGHHELAFHIDLPKDGLLSTFESKQSPGSVQYWVEVTCLYETRQILKRKVLFPVVVDFDLNNIPRVNQIVEEKRNFPNGPNNYVNVTMKLPKTAFTPGESIDAEITLENRSKKSIKYCTMNILQKHHCFADKPHSAHKETKYETPGLPMPMDKVVSGATQSYQTKGHFHVPALPLAPSVDDFLVVEYYLQLTIGHERGRRVAFGTLLIPIHIGTTPLIERNDPEAILPVHRAHPSPTAPITNEMDLFADLPDYASYQMVAPSRDTTRTPPPKYEEIDQTVTFSQGGGGEKDIRL